VRYVLTICCALLLMISALPAYAQRGSEGNQGLLPTRYGVGLLLGTAYDPDSIGLAIIQGQMLVDYERLAWHRAPDPLRLKFEANAGITTDGRQRGLLAVNALALYYLEGYRAGHWTPYLEGGIGLIYTDFQVEDQGLRVNFNPQLGAGIEYALPNRGALSAAVRLHHVSNGDLYRDNRGINSVLLMIGYLF